MDLDAQLVMVGYDPLWIEWGLLDPAAPAQQIEAFHSGGDSSPEHYRFAAFLFAAFLAVLASHACFDQITLDRYFHLAAIDPDPTMAHAALCEVIAWRGLTTKQLDDLSLHPAFLPHPMPKLIQRRLLTEYASVPLTDDLFFLFFRMLDTRDKALEACLLDRPDLSQEHLRILSVRCVGKSHRNRARVRLHET